MTYQTASSDDVSIKPSNGVLTFEDGVIVTNVTVSIINDTEAELNENLILQLITATGK